MKRRFATGPALVLLGAFLVAGLPAAAPAWDTGQLATGVAGAAGILLAESEADQTVYWTGEAEDFFGAGQFVTVAGTVRDNAFLAGQKIGVTGRVGGDAFCAAQNIVITSNVDGDVFATGAEVTVARGAVVGGTLYSSTGITLIEGTVRGQVRGGSGHVRIDGEVMSDVHLSVGSLALGPAARVRGELHYEGPEEAAVDPAAVVEGGLHYHECLPEGDDEGGSFWSGILGDIGFWLWGYLGSLVAGAVFLALGKRHARLPDRILALRFGKTLGVGFLAAVALPVGALFAMILVLPLALGLVALGFWAIAAYLSHLVVGVWLGAWILARLGRDDRRAYGALALGLLVLHLAFLVPYVGIWLRLLAVFLGLGGITLALAGGRCRDQARSSLAEPA